MVWKWHRLTDLPQVHDVLWWRETPAARAADMLPVIVRGVEPGALADAMIHVTLGTFERRKWRRWNGCLVIDQPEDMREAGLEQPAGFELNLLPCYWCADFFPHPWPIGRLSDACIQRLPP